MPSALRHFYEACGILMTLTICMSLLKRHQLCAVLRSDLAPAFQLEAPSCCSKPLLPGWLWKNELIDISTYVNHVEIFSGYNYIKLIDDGWLMIRWGILTRLSNMSWRPSQSMRWIPWPSYWRAVEVMAHRNRFTAWWWLEHVFFFFFFGVMSSSQLAKSIIFQRG